MDTSEIVPNTGTLVDGLRSGNIRIRQRTWLANLVAVIGLRFHQAIHTAQ
ncbi:MAG: hypothetical protein ACK5YZ_02710 [bacterium]